MGYCYCVVDHDTKTVHDLYKYNGYAEPTFAELYPSIKGHNFELLGEDAYLERKEKQFSQYAQDDAYNRLFKKTSKKYGIYRDRLRPKQEEAEREARELFAQFDTR